MRAEPRAVGLATRYAALVAGVLLVAVPVYLYLEPPWRGLVPRLAAALVLGVALLELRGMLALRLARHEASALEAARIPPATEDGVPRRLRELTASVRAALRSRRHFETVFWPRLAALATRPLDRPAARRGRGPSLARLREVIRAIEDER
ncbi:MAG: hypothetical protein L0027_07475 [Candidatus Rokubacteria bacterium]|nr:hypothetical protein [Candidatus Rokubacteria bacterium]